MFEKLLFIIMNVHTQLMKFYIYFLEIINLSIINFRVIVDLYNY